MEIKDTGARRNYATGAVRDIDLGKGRCDLMPLDVVGALVESDILDNLETYKQSGNYQFLYSALNNFVSEANYQSTVDMMLDVAKHYEEGALKYGENNWQKGIPIKSYIDSAARHYLKFKRGDDDEPHARAFVWNILCCIWTVIHKPDVDAL